MENNITIKKNAQWTRNDEANDKSKGSRVMDGFLHEPKNINTFENVNVKRTAHSVIGEDDLRISKIIRHLLDENNTGVKLELCKKLQTATESLANAQYICRSFQRLADNMLSIIREGPNTCSEAASVVFGSMCYINRADFYKWRHIIFDEFDRCNSSHLKECMMIVLKRIISCDADHLKLTPHSADLMVRLKERLENASIGQDFMIISETITVFAKCYSREFEQHFTDFVDIIVGWHLETDQPFELKIHCSIVLQKFSSFFIKDHQFTRGLLEQFLEDIAVCGENVMDDTISDEERQLAEMRFGAFVGTFNTVIKGLMNEIPLNDFAHLILKAIASIIATAKETLCRKLCCEETIVNLNEFMYIVVTNCNYLLSTSNIQNLESIIKLEIELCQFFDNQQKLSLLWFVLSMVRELGNSLSISMVDLIFYDDLAAKSLHSMKLTRNKRVYKLLLRIYHEVLLLKNVRLVQRAYPRVTNKVLGHHIIAEETQQALKILFNVNAISILAIQTSSMITMHALNPPIFQYLLMDNQLTDPAFGIMQPTLQNAFLRVLLLHCSKHRQFLDSSFMINERFMSIQSGCNFSSILTNLYTYLLYCRNHGSAPNIHVVLNWAHILLKQCTQSASVLWLEGGFFALCDQLCQLEYLCATKLPLKHAACIQTMLNYVPKPPLLLLQRMYHLTRATLMQCHGKDHEQIQRVYSQILARLPVYVTLMPQEEPIAAVQLPCNNVQHLHEWYKTTGQYIALRSKYFKPLLKTIDAISPMEDVEPQRLSFEKYFYDCFNHCWTLNANASNKASEYFSLSQNNPQLLYAWIHHETARYCVHNKLRTTVGKPQETFLAIEAIIMRYARLFSVETTFSSKPLSHKSDAFDLWTKRLRLLTNARQILGFLEELEKCIYNAAEGCAFALLPTENAAKTFFRINLHTCQEWFKRINPAICLIAVHAMQPEMCVRYCENLLRDRKIQSGRLEHTIAVLTRALLNCGESTTLHGLYSWLNSKLGQRYVWIQHAANQATGRREVAAEGYLAVLTEAVNDSDTSYKMDTYLREFLLEQLYECLYSTAQWKRICELHWMWSLQTHRKNHLKAMDILCFGEDNSVINNDLSALLSLTEWDEASPSLDQQRHQTGANNSSMILLHQLEDACMAKIFKPDDNEQINNQLRSAVQNALLDSLCVGTFNGHLNSIQKHYLILNHVMGADHWCDDVEHDAQDICAQMGADVNVKWLLWSRLLENNIRSSESGSHSLSQYLNLASAARREGNLSLCNLMLNRFFQLHGTNTTTANITLLLQRDSYKLNIEDALMLRALAELTECMNVAQDYVNAISLGSVYCHQIVKQLESFAIVENNSIVTGPATAASQMLLRLAEWLQTQRGSNSETVCNMPELQLLLSSLPIDGNVSSIDSANIPIAEYAVGRLIYGSIAHSNDIAEAWYVYGNLCYRWGKRVFESSHTNLSGGGIPTHYRNAIRNLLHGEKQMPLLSQLELILRDHKLSGTYDASQIDEEDENTAETERDDESPETIDDYKSCETLRSELLKLDVLDTEQIAAIVHIWRQMHGNVYYETAIRAYFRYLAIAAESPIKKEVHVKKVTSSTMDCMFVTTTLRILRLIVKHALGLQETFEEVLNNTPMRPWKTIIPQLFSRLNHNEPYVRKIVSELLCKLSEKHSNLVLYPAVIGAMQERPPEMPDAATALECNLQQNKAKLFDSNSPLKGSYVLNALLQSCGNESKVLELQKFVKELKRITLLWEEYWLHSLGQICSDYGTLFNKLELQAKHANYGSLNMHYLVVVEHLIADLRRVATVTQYEPQSAHERNFQERYNTIITSTIEALQCDYEKTTAAAPNNKNLRPSESWLRIKHLYSTFQQRALRTSATAMKLADLSPWLSRLRDTYISLPGESQYINSVDGNVHILPTKTRPKKLSFLDDKGCRYTYLFKGLEDLHLDERIMQFLNIANSMMIRHSEQNMMRGLNLRAKHYTVIPLGRQSGIIRWVDGMTPLFSIYKKWQQRNAAYKQQQKERHQSGAQPQLGTTTAALIGTRPSELFMAKLAPLLAEYNLKVSDPRKQWPLEVLRRVLTALSNDTPRDLLAKELWCYAFNASKWREIVANYAASAAVMSVIGYVIGLGDRHLDNILINLSNGELLHIDYNVCFEKGKTLRVPEKVPFRMTPNIEEALGLTGIEGTFRLTCENVLRILRKERETLLTLLEAFVYDPLIDWTLNDEGYAAAAHITSAHIAVARIECYQSLSFKTDTKVSSPLNKMAPIQFDAADGEWMAQNLSTWFANLRPQWIKYKNEFESELRNVKMCLDSLINILGVIDSEEEECDNVNKQLAMVHELETLDTAIGSHPLNTASGRFASYKRDFEVFNNIKSNVEKVHKRLQHQLSIISNGESNLATLDQRCLLLTVDTTNNFELCQRLELCKDVEDSRRELGHCVKILLEHEQIRKYVPRARQEKRSLMMSCNRWYHQLLASEIDAATMRLKILAWHEHLQNLIIVETNRALEFASALKNKLTTLSQQKTKTTNLSLCELQNPEVLTLDIAIHKLRTTMSNDSTSEMKNALYFHVVQTIEKQNKKFLKDDLKSTALEDELLELQITHIKFVQSLCQIIPLPSDSVSSEMFTQINLLNSTLQSLNVLKKAFELPLLQRIVQLLMRDDRDDLQLLLQLMCKNSARAQDLINDVRRTIDSNNNDFYTILRDISMLFTDFESKLEQLSVAAHTIFQQYQDQLPSNLQQLESKITNKNVRFTIEKWKYDMIAQVFNSAYRFVQAMNSLNTKIIYDIREMSTPVVSYVHNVENVFLGGITTLFTYSLHIHLKSTITLQPTVHSIVYAEMLWKTIVDALHHSIAVDFKEEQTSLHAKRLEHQEKIFQAFCWSNDINPIELNKEFYSNNIIRTIDGTVFKIQNNFANFHTIIEELDRTKSQQSSSLDIELEHSRFYIGLSQQVREYTEALICYKYMEKEQIFAMLDQWEISYSNWARSRSLITPAEKAIVQLLDPEGNIDKRWIENITGLLDEIIYEKQRNLDTLEQEKSELYNKFNTNNGKLQMIKDDQEQCICHILKLMLKSSHSLYSYANTIYGNDKHYHSQLAKIRLRLNCIVPDVPILVQLRIDLEKVIELLVQNHQDMLEFMERANKGETQHPPLRVAQKCNNGLKGFGYNDKRACNNQNEQKRNAYAVSVWKRIRMKLEGRDHESNSRSTVTDQVNFIICEAINPDNLAVLYEGWTPWV